MDLATTLAVGAAALAVGIVCGWMGARPWDPRRGPRLAPYRFIMLLAAAVVLLMLVHLVNLLGVTTGR